MNDCTGAHPCHETAAQYGRPWSALLSLLASLAVARNESCCMDCARNDVAKAAGLPYCEPDNLGGTGARALVGVGARVRIGRELLTTAGPPTSGRSAYWVPATAGAARYGGA